MSHDVDFNLKTVAPDVQDSQGTKVKSNEVSRRNKASKIKVQVHLLVNGQRVCKSREDIPVAFPAFEAPIYEIFHINLFTMPSSL